MKKNIKKITLAVALVAVLAGGIFVVMGGGGGVDPEVGTVLLLK